MIGLFKKKDKTAGIIALSPNDKLYENENSSDFIKYESFLKSAFSNRNVRNIAITGNHGVGKSSIIRSYESKDKKCGKGYLYISLMDFNNNRGIDFSNINKESTLSSEETAKLKNAFEHYLLCQILSRVDSHHLPHSTFRLIPKRRKWGQIFVPVLVTIITLSIFGILFNKQLGIPAGWLKTLYYICGGAAGVTLLLFSSLFSKLLVSAKISAKYKGIEVQTEATEISESYIDAHLFEIVYALETLADDIGYTVVLEDMDRLGRNICVDIFSKLRRVNYLVNDRKKLGNKYVRFIYAFDDSVFELTKNTKFFDYVMSVTPKLNYNTAGDYFKDLMLELAITYKSKNKKIFDIINGYEKSFWQIVGTVVHDYRTINHIRNDFQLFVDIMLNRNLIPNNKWLPFVVYKNVLAEDYCRSFEEKGILDIEKQERHSRITTLCSRNGDTYIAFVQILFDYLIDDLRLNGKDFQLFTGVPKDIIKITHEVNEQMNLKEFLNKKVEPDYSGIGEFVSGKTILITGGAGFIGSELCRQLARYDIKALIIVDISENASYDIQQELLIKMRPNSLRLYIEIASIRDKDKMDLLFKKYTPDIVFHAAAHKHVPLMENNPEEAIKNNILGTYNLVVAAETNNVERFILISTDKAVTPTNIMGAPKRFCEMLIQSRKNSNTIFSVVRFGNVISTTGSVISFFKRQIENGGPITITDKRIIRYFMTVSESVELILKASIMAENSRIFVLDMGRPVRIISLAESLIRSYGFTPYKDIEIVEVGLQPGQKLYEELLVRTESLGRTTHDSIFVEENNIDKDQKYIEQMISKLKDAIKQHKDSNILVNLVKEVVPMYAKYDPHQD